MFQRCRVCWVIFLIKRKPVETVHSNVNDFLERNIFCNGCTLLSIESSQLPSMHLGTLTIMSRRIMIRRQQRDKKLLDGH